MTITMSSVSQLSDYDLLASVKRAADDERRSTAELIALLTELDTRKLYLGEGCSSLFTYCTKVLNLSEHAAYGRIEAARAARRFPTILAQLAEGALTLTAVGLLAPHLTPENHLAILEAARHRSKRDVRATAPRAGSSATLDSKRRSGRDLREGADRLAEGTLQDQARRGGSTSARS